MTLSAHRLHKIYIAATMGYSLGSDDLEEVAYYKQIKEEMKQDKGKRNSGILRRD